jgi:hypothetical protein
MSQTDIYKDNKPLSTGAEQPEKSSSRRRRSSSRRRFDEKDRSKSMRRSRNSGARRLKHVWKKEYIQKRINILLITLGILFILFVAVWEFWYQDYKAKIEQDRLQQRREEVLAEKMRVANRAAQSSAELSLLPAEDTADQ